MMVLARIAGRDATGARCVRRAGEVMKYTVSKSVVQVLGRIWMPSIVAAMEYTLSPHHVETARSFTGRITRESVQGWLDTHAGDFAEVLDFKASIEVDGETVEIDWADEESEWAYADCWAEED
jgi:hypothetical protein